ncbi:MAG: CDP-glycerol glycerophosphotransferase family protein [Candidatus Nanopelagicales bacterium]
MSLIPPGSHAVVSGSPDDEGNSVEVVRALAGRRRVYWLVRTDPDSLKWLICGAGDAWRVTCIRMDTIRAQWLYVTARYVFFTHGLYGSPQPPRNKTFVNLWHGDGPKRRSGFAVVRSTVVVSGTLLWGSMRAQSFGLDERAVLSTGNPRVDQFERPVADDGLSSLGIDPSKPLVMWLPTFRKTQFRGNRIGSVRDWSDTEMLSSSLEVRTMLVMLADEARTAGVTLIVKPHRLDADEYSDTGLRIVTSAELREAHVTLYQLLARAHGLITDYSSVWTDFLARNKPIAFYCPDLEGYIVNRGLNVDDPSLLPGPMLENREDFRTFIRDCINEPVASQARRARSID